MLWVCLICIFFFQAEDGIRDLTVTGVQTCALPISGAGRTAPAPDAAEAARRPRGGRAAGSRCRGHAASQSASIASVTGNLAAWAESLTLPYERDSTRTAVSRTCPDCNNTYDDEVLHCPEDGRGLSDIPAVDDLIGRTVGSYSGGETPRQGRHGVRLHGRAPRDRVAGGDQVPAPAVFARRDDRRSLLQRGARGQRHRARQHPQDPRLERHRGSPALLRDGVPARPPAAGAAPAQRFRSPGRGGTDPAPGLRRSPGRAQTRGRPSP